MLGFNQDKFRLKHFIEKRKQLLQNLDRPLLLFWGKWDNPNIRALTIADGFSRPTFVLIKPDGETTAMMQAIEIDQMRPLEAEMELVPYKKEKDLLAELEARLPFGEEVYVEVSDKAWGFDLLSPKFYKFLDTNYKLHSAYDILLQFRGIKIESELYLIQEAAKAMLKIFAEVDKFVTDGTPEQDIINLMRIMTLKMGGADAFDPIVASGTRSVEPHPSRTSVKLLRSGERLIVDYGVAFMGYRSDMTRTWVVDGNVDDDPLSPVSRAVWEFVRSADLSDYTLLSFGKAITDVIDSYGHKGLLRHGHGHGLGAETHDPYPYIADIETPTSGDSFKDGMVFTIEPGFYEEIGGLRFEDDFVVIGNRAVRAQDMNIELNL